MKQTLNINLGGYPFIIDDDAYHLLKDYLDTIRFAFDTNDDTEDLATDIESRIAEILLEKEGGNVRIVTLEEISYIIERIGKPADFIDMDNTSTWDDNDLSDEIMDQLRSEECANEIPETENQQTVTPPPYIPNQSLESPVRKKLFRDPQNAMLGGVCSGLAVYLNLDPTIVRLITVALFFLSASTMAIAYIILWLVIPEARTPLQRMQMRGENPTVENIGRSVTENYREDSAEDNEVHPQRSGFWKFIYNCCSIFVKFLIVLGIFIAVPVILALFLVLLACIVALCTGFSIGDGFFGNFLGFGGYGSMIFHLILAVVGGIITIGIPLWLIFQRRSRRRDISDTLNNRRSLVVLWIAGIALLSIFTPKTARDVKRLVNSETAINSKYLEKKTDILKKFNLTDKDLRHLSISEDGVVVIDKNGNKIIIDVDGIVIDDASGEIGNNTTKEIVTGDSISLNSLMEIEIQEQHSVIDSTYIPNP